jgi:hypothetical protein
LGFAGVGLCAQAHSFGGSRTIPLSHLRTRVHTLICLYFRTDPFPCDAIHAAVYPKVLLPLMAFVLLCVCVRERESARASERESESERARENESEREREEEGGRYTHTDLHRYIYMHTHIHTCIHTHKYLEEKAADGHHRHIQTFVAMRARVFYVLEALVELGPRGHQGLLGPSSVAALCT